MARRPHRIRPPFFAREPRVVARELVGALLVRDEVVLRVTEVEAYGGPDDSASHARSGRTGRNAPMWGPGGRAYVYLCYGIHSMLNVVAHPPETAGAVLIRSCEVLAGHELVRARRGGRTGPEALAGPGKVGAALGLDVSWSGHDLLAPGGLELLHPSVAPEAIVEGARVGIDYALEADRIAALRFAWAGSRAVSHRKLLAASP